MKLSQSEVIQAVAIRIAHALSFNSSSWVLLNAAGLYWRAQGDAYEVRQQHCLIFPMLHRLTNTCKAVECLRRAYEVAPWSAKDVALVGLANIFFEAGYPYDAIAVLQIAIQVRFRTSFLLFFFFVMSSSFGL